MPEHICLQCSQPFHVQVNQLRNGRGIYCTRDCMLAYQRLHGRKTRPIETRFWKHVDKTSSPHGCWLWTGALSHGYGSFYIAPGLKSHAHRAAWELTHGPILPIIFVCHNCPGGDNRACVNPGHLFLGSNSDNIQDAVKKGTFHFGERHWSNTDPEKHRRTRPRGTSVHTSCFTAEDVYLIRSLKGQHPARVVAAPYGVSTNAIYDIWRGKTWKHLV